MSTSCVTDSVRVPGEPTSEQQVRTFLSAANKGRSTIHGDLYHQRLAIMAILRAYRTHQEDNTFSFLVAVEVEQAGKFDDIMYFYTSPQLGTGTFFIQVKHKLGSRFKITKEALCAAPDTKSAYSIPVYFTSFLEVSQRLPDNARYVLCTNATLDKRIETCFTIVHPQQQDRSLQFCDDIEATCYRFSSGNPVPRLSETLKDSCLALLGVKLAEIVFAGRVITFEDPLLNTFAGLLNNCVEQLAEETCDSSSVSTFRFNQHFLTAANSTAEGKIRKSFTKGRSKRHSANLHELNIQIDRHSFVSARRTGPATVFAQFDRKVIEFYSKFVLVCNALNEVELDRKAFALLPQWCDAEHGTALRKLKDLLLEAMASGKAAPLDLSMVQACFTDSDLKRTIRSVKRSSLNFCDSLRAKHPSIEVDPKRSHQSPLLAFLQDRSGRGGRVRLHRSSLELTVSCYILVQLLALIECETLFVDSGDYSTGEDLCDALHDVLSYLRDVNHPTIKVTTVVKRHSGMSIADLRTLAKTYRQKIVVIEQTVESPRRSDDRFVLFSGEDLTPEAWCKLLGQTDRTVFGTAIPLSKLVDEREDLSLLLDVIKACERLGRIANHNQKNYDKISHWYVQRQCSRHEEETDTVVLTSSCFNDIRVERALAAQHEQPYPPAIESGGDGGKVCIVLNDAGHGKSSYLTWLAWRLSSHDPSLYVTKLIAKEYSTDFDQLQMTEIKNADDTALARLLYRYIHLALFVPDISNRSIQKTNVDRANADRCAALVTVADRLIVLDKAKEAERSTDELVELRLFRAKFNERKLVLILDGFDEIAPDYKDVVMHCFARMVRLHGVRSFYLASRPYGFAEDLGRTFAPCQFYRLKPFSLENITVSWHKFLHNNLEGYRSYGMEDCADILHQLDKTVSHTLGSLVTVPLMLHMVQTILLPEIAKRVQGNTHSISFDMLRKLKLDKYQLVKRFVDMQLAKYHTDIAGKTDAAGKTVAARRLEERLNKEIKERHMLLAVYVIFNPERTTEVLLSRDETKRCLEMVQEVIEGDEKTGFVLGVVDGIPQFIHRVFAEFFAAHWLYSNRDRFRRERIFQSQAFWSNSFTETHYFLNSLLLAEGCDLHRALLNEDWTEVEQILHDNPCAIFRQDEAGRLPIHLTAFCRSWVIDTLETMLSAAVYDKDKLYGWNALDYAFARNAYHVVSGLLARGAPVNVDVLLQQLFSNDTVILLEQGICYVSYLAPYKHQKAAVNKLCAGVAKYLIHERKVNLHAPHPQLRNSTSMLEYCVLQDCGSMIKQFIEQSHSGRGLNFDTCCVPLLHQSLAERAYAVATYFLEHRSSLETTISVPHLIACGRYAINVGEEKLFKRIFRELCIRHQIQCVNENCLSLEQAERHMAGTKKMAVTMIDEYDCCTYSAATDSSITADYDETFHLQLLAEAVRVGSLRLTAYIVQCTKMTLNEAIVGQLVKYYTLTMCHGKSLLPFTYLLTKFDLRKDGPTLFDRIVGEGCLYMLPALFAMGFDPTQINLKYLSHHLTHQPATNRTSGLIRYLHQQSYVDFFQHYESIRASLFAAAVRGDYYFEAKQLFQNEYGDESDTVKLKVLVNLVGKDLAMELFKAWNFKQNFTAASMLFDGPCTVEECEEEIPH